MKEEKVKINLRVGIRIRDILEGEASFEDIRIGSLTNRLLQEELAKMQAVGADHCLMEDTNEYRAALPEAGGGAGYYILPRLANIEKYISTRLDNKNYPQISLYFTPEQVELMQDLVRRQRIRSTLDKGLVKSYRYVVVGMLLNHPLCRSLGAAAQNEPEPTAET